MKRCLAAALLITVGLGITSAAPLQIWMDKAAKFYEQSAFDSAAYYFQNIADAGIVNGDNFYNLGNSYYRLHKPGLALLYYEKARKLYPNDLDIKANIRFVNMNISDRIPEPERGFVAAGVYRIHTLFPLSTQLWLLLGFLLVIALMFVIGLFSSRNIRLWIIYCLSLLIAVALFLGISVGIKINEAENISYAIVLDPTVDARNQPNGQTILFTVHEGTKFRMRQMLDQWCLVSLPNGVSGWVPLSALGKI